MKQRSYLKVVCPLLWIFPLQNLLWIVTARKSRDYLWNYSRCYPCACTSSCLFFPLLALVPVEKKFKAKWWVCFPHLWSFARGTVRVLHWYSWLKSLRSSSRSDIPEEWICGQYVERFQLSKKKGSYFYRPISREWSGKVGRWDYQCVISVSNHVFNCTKQS